MSVYQHVLVGLDLSPESDQVISRVKALFSEGNVKISLLHVQEPLSFAYAGDIPMGLTEVQTQLEEQAGKRIKSYANQLGQIPVETHVIIGQPAHEMHRFVKENNVDLIVVGSHGKHGLSLIFGSTSSSVLHGAGCDVLAVRVTSAE